MKSRRRRQVLCLFMALWMAMCTPASSRAFLTELVVGGSMLAEIGGTIVSALPQVTMFASSILALAKTSEDIADTVGRILSVFIPGKGGKDEKKSAGDGRHSAYTHSTSASVAGAAPSADSLSTAGHSQASGGGASDTDDQGQGRTRDSARLDKLLDGLVLSFTRQISLLRQLQELPEGDPARESLGAGYTELVSESSQRIEEIVTRVLDAVEDGDAKLVDAFLEKVQGYDAADRVAMVPVLTQLVDRGKSFSRLHGTSAGTALLERIAAVAKEIVKK